MAQRTVFPAIPNTAEAQYPIVLNAVFTELQRREGPVPFKKFRPWLKERNIYNKEEVEELFHFLGCPSKPEFALGDFATKYLACGGSEEQKALLYQWVKAWNQFLVKYIFEALDVESGGRLHSTHELYRMITSYVYAGEYVTLPNFQNWIKWMAGTGYIKYIGIRWGLSESGKNEMTVIRQLDVDELLEDEEEERLAAEAAEAAAEAIEQEPEPASPPEQAPAQSAPEEDLPDMPPEPPVPTWEPPEAEASAEPQVDVAAPPAESPAPPAPAITQPPPRAELPAARVAKGPVKADPPRASSGAAQATSEQVKAWFAGYPKAEGGALPGLGLNAKVYHQAPGLFILQAALAARLAERHPAVFWRPFLRSLAADGTLGRYFKEDLPIEQLLGDRGWFVGRPDHARLFGEVALDLMRLRAALKGSPRLTSTLEESTDPSQTLRLIADNLFAGELSGPTFWLVREMVLLDLWDDPGCP